jgi:parvulin-like peptidyl-prolyl isomerase
MNTVLQIGNYPIDSEEIIPRLASYQMLPQLYRERIVDEAIAPISCTQAEIADACQQFYEQNQLIDEKARHLWLHHQGMNRYFLETVFIPRLLKIEKFKHQTWNHKLDSYFLQRKRSFDRAIYSLMRLRLNNAEIAREFYFRIQEKEQSFAELARQYSQGPESQVDGIIGPIELGNLHPQLAQILAISKPGQLWHPIPIEGWLLIIRLERLIPAQLDAAMRQRLLSELFENWVQKQCTVDNGQLTASV